MTIGRESYFNYLIIVVVIHYRFHFTLCWDSDSNSNRKFENLKYNLDLNFENLIFLYLKIFEILRVGNRVYDRWIFNPLVSK
uniref:Uncharacterized protein n=1 Tax=Heterorhabditis bacteriophora TaxID=37862 RepID=A0A1I7WED8_HETBA